MTDENRIMAVYGALVLSLLLMLVPHLAAALLSLVVFTGVLGAAYRLRCKAEAQGLLADHMGFVVRTIWIGLALTFVTTVAGGLYMLAAMDGAPLESCAQQAAAMMTAGSGVEIQAINRVLQPCLARFLQVNAPVMMAALLIAAVLPALYFAVRIARGMSRARKGHRIGNVKSWF